MRGGVLSTDEISCLRRGKLGLTQVTEIPSQTQRLACIQLHISSSLCLLERVLLNNILFDK